jgi:hypothetical protein
VSGRGGDLVRGLSHSHPGPPHKGEGEGVDAAAVVARLEAAGATLLAMPSRGYSTQLRMMRFDVVQRRLCT